MPVPVAVAGYTEILDWPFAFYEIWFVFSFEIITYVSLIFIPLILFTLIANMIARDSLVVNSLSCPLWEQENSLNTIWDTRIIRRNYKHYHTHFPYTAESKTIVFVPPCPSSKRLLKVCQLTSYCLSLLCHIAFHLSPLDAVGLKQLIQSCLAENPSQRPSSARRFRPIAKSFCGLKLSEFFNIDVSVFFRTVGKLCLCEITFYSFPFNAVHHYHPPHSCVKWSCWIHR